MFSGFLVSMMAISKASFDGLLMDRIFRRELKWDKTARYRDAQAADASKGQTA